MNIEGQEELYDVLNSQGLYSKSLDEFKDQFSSTEKQSKLYDKLYSTGLYDKSEDEFVDQFFGAEKKNPNQSELLTEEPIEATIESVPGTEAVVETQTEVPQKQQSSTASQQSSAKPKSSSGGGMLQMSGQQASESQKPKPGQSQGSLLIVPKGTKTLTPAEAALQRTKESIDITNPNWAKKVAEREKEAQNFYNSIDVPVVTKRVAESAKTLAQQAKVLEADKAKLDADIKAFEATVKANPRNPELGKLQADLNKRIDVQNKINSEFQGQVTRFNQDRADLKRASAIAAIKNEEKGNFLGATWNSIVEGYKKIGQGQARLAIDLVAEVLDAAGLPLSADKNITKDDAKKAIIAEINPALSKGYDVAKSEGTTKEYIEKQKQSGVLPKAWFGAMESLPVMASGAGAGGTIPRFVTGASLAYQYANDELDANPATSAMDENERKKITIPIAVIGGVLEELGFRTLIGKNKPLLIKLAGAVIEQLPPNATIQTIKKTVQEVAGGPTIKALTSTAGKLATGYLGEAETGGSQKLLDFTVKRIYEKANDVEIFKSPKTFSELAGKVAEDANIEGIGGVLLRSIGIGASTAMSVTGVGQMSDKEYEAWKKYATDPVQGQLYLSKVVSDLASDRITQEEAARRVSDYDRSTKIAKQIPDNLSIADQKKAFSIIAENQRIEAGINDLERYKEGKNPNLVTNTNKKIEDLQKRIEENNNQLTKLSENAVQEQTTSEVPIQPEAGTRLQMAEGEPQAEPQGTTQEGQGQEVVSAPGSGMLQMATSEQPAEEKGQVQEIVDITANIPKQDLPKVMDLVSRIENGKDTSSPDDLQTQQNYAKEIEALLAKRASESGQPTIPVVDVKTPTKFEEGQMPEMSVDQIDWEASKMGSKAQAMDLFGGINNITVVDVRGKNEQGQYVGKIRVTGQDSSLEGVVVFNDPDAPRKPTVGRKRNASPNFEMADNVLSNNGVYPSFENVQKIVELTEEKPGEVTAEDIQNIVKLGNKKAKAIADALNKPKVEEQKVPEASVEEVTTETTEQPVEELPLSEAPSVTEVEEEKPAVPFTEEPKRSPFSSIPGYDRMMGEIKGIIDKSFKRGVSFNQTLDNALQYMYTSRVYEDADDTQREEMVREVRKMFDKKEAKNKSLQSMKLKEPPKKALVNTKTLLYERLKEIDQSIKEGQRNFKQAVKDMATEIKSRLPKGVFSTAQVRVITNALASNLLNPKLRDQAMERVNRVLNNVEEATKLKEAYDLRTKIKNANTDNLAAELKDIAKGFSQIDPRYIDNIDEHLEQARQVYDAIKSVKVKDVEIGRDEDGKKITEKQVQPRSIIDYAATQDYTQKQLNKQDEIVKEALLEQYKNLVAEGKIDESMSLAKIKDYIKSVEQDKNNSTEEKDKAIMDFAKESFSESKEELEQAIEDGAIEQEDVPLIEGFTKIDVSLMDPMQAYEAAEALMNYRMNGSTSKMGKVLANYIGALGIKNITDNVSRDGTVNVGGTRFLRYKALGKALDKFVQLLSFGKKKPNLGEKFSKAYSDIWLEYNATMDNLGATYFGPKNWLAIKEASGLDEIIKGVVQRKVIIEQFRNEIHDKYENKKIGKDNVFTAKNAQMLGIISFLYRETSDTKQADTYFDKRKKSLKETIDYLISSKDSDEKKKGELLKEIYDELDIENATNGKEIFDNADPVAREVINDFINKFKEYYPDFSRIAQQQFNIILGQDNNYLPDSWMNVGKETKSSADKLFRKGNFAMNSDVIDTEESGSFIKPKFPDGLPKRNGKVNRILNFDFFQNNMNVLAETINTVKTINGVNKYVGFMDSPNLNKLITDEASRNFFKDRVDYNVSVLQMDEKIGKRKGYTKGIVDFFRMPTKLGTTVGLSSAQSVLTQSAPILVNTAINLRNPAYLLLATQYVGNRDMKDFLNNIDYGIKERGHTAQTNIDYSDNMLERGDYSTPEKALEMLKKGSRFWVDNVLVGTDVLTAKTTWMAYYMDELAKQGVNPLTIDWKNHKVNDQAAKYAEMMVQREQNINLPELGGKMWSSKDSRMRLARMTMPFASFTTSQKDKIKANMAVLFMDNNLATREEKIAAAKSLVASAGEQYVFNTIKSLIMGNLTLGAYGIAKEKETEEERKIREKKVFYQKIADIFEAFNGSVDFLEKEGGAIFNNFLLRATENLFDLYDEAVEKKMTVPELMSAIRKKNWASDNKIEKDKVEIYPFDGPRSFKTQKQIKRDKLKEDLKKPFRFYESEEATGPETVARLFGGVPKAAYDTWAKFVMNDLPDIYSKSITSEDGEEAPLTQEEVGKLLMAIPIKIGAGVGYFPRETKNLADYTSKIIKENANLNYKRRLAGRRRENKSMNH